VPARRVTKDLPRRAIIVGSFEWIAKRVSLAESLGVADRPFARAGVELCVVGSAEESYLSRFRRNVVVTTFTGRVDDVAHYMALARLALVLDRLAGFKLKTLDCIFDRVPILGISGSISGVPLRPDEDVLLFPDHQILAEGVVRVIDDSETLNEMQDLAYDACRDQFDWARIASSLVSAISLREGLTHEACLLAPLLMTA
jgi:glycosyltransferase involved in cell wall biosynthesis